MDITLLHDSFTEYYASEWLIDQLNTPNWSDNFDEIGAIDKYPVWSESVNVMCDLLSAEQHEKIIELYQDWEKYEYGLSYLVKHVALSKSSERVLGFITPPYIREKLARFQSPGPMIDDIDMAITAATDNSNLVSAFKYAVLKEHIYNSVKRPMLGLESVFRARMGETERAIADVEHFGNHDDRLLVYAETIVQLWDKAPSLIERYLNRIYSILQNCSPKVIELAALRLAEVTPATALDLAKKIPEPEFLENPSTGDENPNKGRCMFRIFEILTEHDLDMAPSIVEETKDTFDRIYSYVAIGVALMPKRPPQAFEVFDKALSLIQDEINCQALRNLLTRYALWEIPKMDSSRSISAFQSITEFNPFFPNRSVMVSILDAEISECSELWVKAVAELPVGLMRDLVQWRLTVVGYMPPAEPESFEDQIIRDLVRANCIAEASETSPLEAVEMAIELETLVGYVCAISGIAEQLKDSDPEAAQTLIGHAFESLPLERNWTAVGLVLELLKMAIHWPGALRRKIFIEYVRLTGGMEPKYSQADACSFLGRIIAASLIGAKPDEASFFKSLIMEFDAENIRSLIATYMLMYLPSEECERIAEHLQEFGIAVQGDLSSPIEHRLFLPETSVALLTRLAEKVQIRRPQLAVQLLLEAADLSATIEDESDRNDATSEVIRRAMRYTPSFVWEVYPRCENNYLFCFRRAVEDVLNDYPGDNDYSKERYLRVVTEYFLAGDVFGDNVDNRKYAGKRLFSLKEGHFSLLDAANPRFGKPSERWLRDLANFFAKYVEHFLNNTDSLYDLQRTAELVAQIDWGTFMSIVRYLRFGKFAAEDIISKKLRVYLYTSQTEASQLLHDITTVWKLWSDDEEDRSEATGFYHTIMAAMAAYCPDVCIDMIASLPPESRCSFTDELGDFAPEEAWAECQLSTLFKLLEESLDRKAVVVTEACILSWLSQKFEFPYCFVERIVHRSSGLSESSHIREIAGHIKHVDLNKWEALIRAALDRAIQNRDALDIVETLEEADFLAPEIRLHALAIAIEAEAQTERRYHFDSIAKQQARLSVEEALTTLGLMRPDHSDIEEVLDTLSECITLSAEGDIELWVERISGLGNLNRDNINHFAHVLIKHGIAAGIVASSQKFRHITKIDDRVEVFLLLAGNMEEREKGKILEEACGEAENATILDQRERAFRKLGEFYLHSDRGRAVDFFGLSLMEATKGTIAFSFISSISEAAQICLQLPISLAKKLGTQIRDAVQRFPYASNFQNDVDSKAQAMLWSTIALWSSSKSEAIEVLREAVAEHSSKTRARRKTIWEWNWHMGKACIALTEHLDVDSGKEMLTASLSSLNDSEKKAMADDIAMHFINFSGGTDEPLEKLGIRQKRLTDTTGELLKHIMQLCSLRVVALSHFAFGITAWGREHDIVIHEMACAVNTLKQSGNFSGDIWLAHAAAHGFEACLHAAHSLFTEKERFLSKANHLLICAIDQMPQKAAFLRDLWNNLRSLEEYT